MQKIYVSIYEAEAKTYKGFKSPAPGDLPQNQADYLSKVYGGCRSGEVEKDPDKKENPASKTKCAKIAWTQLHKKYK